MNLITTERRIPFKEIPFSEARVEKLVKGLQSLLQERNPMISREGFMLSNHFLDKESRKDVLVIPLASRAVLVGEDLQISDIDGFYLSKVGSLYRCTFDYNWFKRSGAIWNDGAYNGAFCTKVGELEEEGIRHMMVLSQCTLQDVMGSRYYESGLRLAEFNRAYELLFDN